MVEFKIGELKVEVDAAGVVVVRHGAAVLGTWSGPAGFAPEALARAALQAGWEGKLHGQTCLGGRVAKLGRGELVQVTPPVVPAEPEPAKPTRRRRARKSAEE